VDLFPSFSELAPKLNEMENSYSKQDKTLLEKIGNRIKDLRIQSGPSQEKLAFACELDRTYIGSIERGERNISGFIFTWNLKPSVI